MKSFASSLLLLAAAALLASTACAATPTSTTTAPVAAAPNPHGNVRLVAATDDGLFDGDERSSRRPVPDRTDCDVEYLGGDLTGNRYNGLPPRHLQVVVFYDGHDSSPELQIGLTGGGSITVGGESAGGPIEPFGRVIETREYELYDCRPDGRFEISGVDPNGVIDGLAFGVLWTDDAGRYTMLKSNGPGPSSGGAAFVGMWPLGFGNDDFAARTAAITTGFGRESARTIITGAALLDDGELVIDLPGRIGASL
jgi:hypothetical protein